MSNGLFFKKLICTLCLGSVAVISSSTHAEIISSQSSILLHRVIIEPRISYEQYQMPNHVRPLGVIGLHGLIDFNPWVYGGIGLYSAVKGEKGGYFALALEGGLQHYLFHQVLIDGGMRIGGGGGHQTDVGGGLFYEPYLGLKYDFGRFRTGLYYSYIRFVYGKIASGQFGLELTMPFAFTYATADYIDPCTRFSDINFPFVTYLGSTENYIAVLGRTYLPNSSAKQTNGAPVNSHIEFLGFEAAHYFSQKFFAFLTLAGAFHGNQNGYADELLGLGYRLPLFGSSKLGAVIKLGAGSGGGGSIDTGGGFIYEPMVGLEYHFIPALALEMNGGYVVAPQGSFKAKELSVLLKYYFSNAIIEPLSAPLVSSQEMSESFFQAWRIRVLNQTYLKPQSESGEINPTMQLLGLDFDYFIHRYFYLTGQTAFAYKGLKTGGYFSGMLGIGGETPKIFNTHFYLFGELLGGTAGGAGLDIGQGALVEPVIGINYQVDDGLGLQASVGRLIALNGQFHPTTINLGLSYKFWGIS